MSSIRSSTASALEALKAYRRVHFDIVVAFDGAAI
jgi:hypothetical protein